MKHGWVGGESSLMDRERRQRPARMGPRTICANRRAVAVPGGPLRRRLLVTATAVLALALALVAEMHIAPVSAQRLPSAVELTSRTPGAAPSPSPPARPNGVTVVPAQRPVERLDRPSATTPGRDGADDRSGG